MAAVTTAGIAVTALAGPAFGFGVGGLAGKICYPSVSFYHKYTTLASKVGYLPTMGCKSTRCSVTTMIIKKNFQGYFCPPIQVL